MAATDQTTISNLDEATSVAAGDKFAGDQASTNTTKYYQASTLMGGGRYLVISAKTADFDAAEGTDFYPCDATSGAIAAQLPAVAGVTAGTVMRFKKTDASGNAVTLTSDGSETIDGSTTSVLSSQYDAATVVCDGSVWHIL